MDERNSMGKTALNILDEIPEDKISERSSDIQIILANMSREPKVESVTFNEITLVVVALIATMAFQVMVNPPGGVWQDDKFHPNDTSETPYHRAGKAVMLSANAEMYDYVVGFSSLALGTSLVTVVLITTGLSSRYRSCMWLALAAMWISIASVGCCSALSVLFIYNPARELSLVAEWGLFAAIFVAVLANMIYLLEWNPNSSAFWKCIQDIPGFKRGRS